MKHARIMTALILCFSIVIVPAVMAAEKESPKKEAKEGATMFKAKCASCHGPEGKADSAMAKKMNIRPMHSAEVQKQSKAEIEKIIEDGKGKMPSYKGKLTKDQIQDLADYIKSLK